MKTRMERTMSKKQSDATVCPCIMSINVGRIWLWDAVEFAVSGRLSPSVQEWKVQPI